MLGMTGFMHVQNALWEQDLVQLKSQVQQVRLSLSFCFTYLACHAIMKNLRMIANMTSHWVQHPVQFSSQIMLVTGKVHHVTAFCFSLHHLSVQLKQQQSQSHPASSPTKSLSWAAWPCHNFQHLVVLELQDYAKKQECFVPDKLSMVCTVKPELPPQSTKGRHDICSLF